MVKHDVSDGMHKGKDFGENILWRVDRPYPILGCSCAKRVEYMKVCDRCGDKNAGLHRIGTEVIELCEKCTNDVLRFIKHRE